MNKVLSFIITAKNKTAEGLSAAMGGVKAFAKSVFTNLMNIQAGFQMLQGAATKMWSVLKSSFHFETLTTQFKTLIGNMDDARAHMQMLKELGDTPPFSLDEFAKASRTMMVMTDNVLGFKASLEMVGDAAAATGIPIETLAHEVGRAYAVIRDGQPLNRATMALRNMGILSPEVAKKLEELQKAGASNIEVWSEFEEALKKHSGAMAETEKTGEGLIGAISSQWDNSVRSFGNAFMDVAKGGMQVLLAKLKKLNEDGTIELWAEKIKDALFSVAETIRTIMPVITGVWKSIKLTFASVGGEIGRFAGAVSMGNFGDAFGGIGIETAKAYTRIFDADGVQAAKDERRRLEWRDRKAERKKKEEAEAAVKSAQEESKIREALADAQLKKDEKDAKEKAAKEEEILRKLAEKKAKDAEKQAKEEELQRAREENARIEMERKIAREKQRLAESDLRESEKEESAAERRLAAAQRGAATAWGWYRDKDTMQAEIDERKSQADAEKQWSKDFERLKSRRRDWRSIEFGKLSADEEAVRQVALAKEEEQAAQKALDEISANTAYLKEIAEALSAGDEG